MTIQLKETLKVLDQKHFLHPTSSIEQQQSEGPAAIFTEAMNL